MQVKKENPTKNLTWDDIANDYDNQHIGSGRLVRTLPMSKVFEWAKRRTNRYMVLANGTIRYKN